MGYPMINAPKSLDVSAKPQRDVSTFRLRVGAFKFVAAHLITMAAAGFAG